MNGTSLTGSGPQGPQESAQTNTEVLAVAIDAFNSRDFETIDGLVDESVEWRPALSPGGVVESTVYRGKQGVAAYIEAVASGLGDMRVDLERIEPVNGDRVFYRAQVSVDKTSSGIPLDLPVWGIWKVQDGKLVRGQEFLSEDEALEAAGQP